jgi:hypothetical protein
MNKEKKRLSDFVVCSKRERVDSRRQDWRTWSMGSERMECEERVGMGKGKGGRGRDRRA